MKYKLIKPVKVTKEVGDEILVITSCYSVREAERFLASNPNIDEVALFEGLYGIDAPELMVNPNRGRFPIRYA